eukprot:TRINITY_DN12163_c0_g3_i4.p1 TRINITY_DN12163_c0_g3~~TRINITY_DN12163_c0_g3_i4.p1  ORF type:complete len:150 (-),score=40.49 TRINITY_DN12163_c0_g3_i4:206-655(-)
MEEASTAASLQANKPNKKVDRQKEIAEAMDSVVRYSKSEKKGKGQSKGSLAQFSAQDESNLTFHVRNFFLQLNAAYTQGRTFGGNGNDYVCEQLNEDMKDIIRKIKTAEKKKGAAIDSLIGEKKELQLWMARCQQRQLRILLSPHTKMT